MCDDFMERLKNDHYLHSGVITFIVYYYSKNLTYGAVAGLGSFIFMMSNSSNKKDRDVVEFVEKSLQNIL